MKWLGKLGDNIAATMCLNNALLSDPKRKCRCGTVVDLDAIADRELGTKPGIALKNMEEYIQWKKQWNVISRKAIEGKISLDKCVEKRIKLWREHQRKAEEWGAKDVSFTATAICPKCQTSLGEIKVTLRLVNLPEIADLTKRQLTNLEASKEMLAYVSKRMQFRNIEQLKEWLANKDAEQAKAALRKTIVEFNKLNLPYETSRITGKLTSLISEIDKEIYSRKVEFVNAVEKIMQERVVVIT